MEENNRFKDTILRILAVVTTVATLLLGSLLYLSQIFDIVVLVNVKLISHILFFSLWSVVLAYLILKLRDKSIASSFLDIETTSKEGRSFSQEDKAQSIKEVIKKRNYDSVFKEYDKLNIEHTPKQSGFNGNNLPVEEKPRKKKNIFEPEKVQKNVSTRTKIESSLSEYAKSKGALVSEDALGLLCIAELTEKKETKEILDSIIVSARAMYPRNDNWIILDKKRLESVMFSNGFNIINVFSNWLSDNESQQVFSFLRVLRSQRLSVKSFFKQVAYYIDHVYRCRIDESLDSDDDMDLEYSCVNWSTKDIEQVVAVLVNGIDESYSSEEAPVKLALVKVLEISEKAMLRGSYYEL